MSQNMPSESQNDHIFVLMEQVERAWNTDGDDELVDRLAAENPQHAETLYDFFATLVEASHHHTFPNKKFESADGSVHAWLLREGFQIAAAGRIETPSSTSDRPSSLESERIRQLSNAPSQGSSDKPRAGKSFLGMLREITGEPTEQLAGALDITKVFLLDVSDHADLVPHAAQSALAERVFRARGIARSVSLQALSVPGRVMPKAASRSTPYPSLTLTFESLIQRSGLSDDRKQHWRLLK